jgi:hypothetical protein
MLDILVLIAPIYILIGLGYGVIRLRYLEADAFASLGSVILRVFMPAMLFLAIAGNPISDTLSWAFVAAYAGGSVATYWLGFALARLSGQETGGAAIEAMGMSCSNSAFFGLPVATLVVGPELALQGFALVILIENLLMIPMAVTICEIGQGRAGAALWRMIPRLLLNPLLLAAGAGLAWALGGLALPPVAERVLRMMAPVAPPLALLMIGGTVAQLSLRGVGGGVMRVVAGKLLLHPSMVALALLLVGGGTAMPDALRLTAVLIAGVPMMSIYAIFGQRFGHEAMSATAQIVATALSILSLPAVIYLAGG